MVEVLVASVVGALLATMAWPTYRSQWQRAGRGEAIEALQKLQIAQEHHREMFGTYAAELRTLDIATATRGGRYRLALAAQGVESYQARAETAAGGPQQGDKGCAALTLEVRQGFATLGPDGMCWNR